MKNYNVLVFEKNLHEYEKWYEKNKTIFSLEIKAIKKLLGNKKTKKTLEIGAGSGRFTKALKITHAIDPSKKLVDFISKNGVNAIKAFGEKIPFRDNEFDAVFIIFSLEFVKRPKKVLKEAKRVLKNRGILILSLVNGKSVDKNSKFYKRARFFKEKEIFKLINEIGFKIQNSLKIINNNNVYKIVQLNHKSSSIAYFISAKKI